MKAKQGKRSATRDEIDESDAWLMVYVAEASDRQGNHDFVQEIRQMPRAERRKISSILTEINCPDGVNSREPWLLASEELRDRLTAAVLAAGGSRSLADAFFLPQEEWYRRHVKVPAPQSPATTVLDPARGDRAEVIHAVGVLNRILKGWSDQTLTDIIGADSAGRDHLLRARAELVRALASPADRAREYEAAQREVAQIADGRSATADVDLGRALRAGVLEMSWALNSEGDVPGGFYFERGWQDLDRVGLDPEVLR